MSESFGSKAGCEKREGGQVRESCQKKKIFGILLYAVGSICWSRLMRIVADDDTIPETVKV